MTHPLHYQPRFSIKPILLDLLIVGSFSLLGLFTGLNPDLQKRFHSMVWGSPVDRQAITDADVLSYVRSVLAIEQMRQTTYANIKQQIGYVPPAQCHNPSHLVGLGDRISEIATDYCNQAMTVVERNGLTVNQFNTITKAQQHDPVLANHIQSTFFCVLSSDSRPLLGSPPRPSPQTTEANLSL